MKFDLMLAKNLHRALKKVQRYKINISDFSSSFAAIFAHLRVCSEHWKILADERISGTKYSGLLKSNPLYWITNERREFPVLLKLIIIVPTCWQTPLTLLQVTALFVMVQLHKDIKAPS